MEHVCLMIKGHIDVEALGTVSNAYWNLYRFYYHGVISIGHGLLAKKNLTFDELKDKFKSFDNMEMNHEASEVAYMDPQQQLNKDVLLCTRLVLRLYIFVCPLVSRRDVFNGLSIHAFLF